MRIAMLTDRLTLGGGPECIRLIAEHLPEHFYTVFCKSGHYPALENLSNVTIIRHLPSSRELKKFDLIHCHHLRSLFEMHIPAGVFVLNTIHGIHSRKFAFGHGLKNYVSGRLRHMLERWLYSHVALNIVLTEDDQHWLEQNYHLQNLIRIPNGVESLLPAVTDLNLKALRDELSIPQSRYLLLMIARFDFQKGQDVLLKAVELSADHLRRTGALVALIGDGPKFMEYKTAVRDRNLDDVVFFCGAHQNAKRFLPLADALLLPSRWEGLPLILLEAGVISVPVIGAAVSGISSLLTDKQTGRLFPCEDFSALASILCEESLFDSLPILGETWHNEVLNCYTVDKMTAAYNRLYHTVSEKNRRE